MVASASRPAGGLHCLCFIYQEASSYLQMFASDAKHSRPKEDFWIGAEIRSCCQLAARLDVPWTAAALNVVPVTVTATEAVERLQAWLADAV